MSRKTRNKPIIKDGQKKAKAYRPPENPIEFYVSEDTSRYGNEKPFTIYYDNSEHSIRLLKGDCIEILNQARENSVDMVFADPPYFLSNGGITCHAYGKFIQMEIQFRRYLWRHIGNYLEK